MSLSSAVPSLHPTADVCGLFLFYSVKLINLSHNTAVMTINRLLLQKPTYYIYFVLTQLIILQSFYRTLTSLIYTVSKSRTVWYGLGMLRIFASASAYAEHPLIYNAEVPHPHMRNFYICWCGWRRVAGHDKKVRGRLGGWQISSWRPHVLIDLWLLNGKEIFLWTLMNLWRRSAPLLFCYDKIWWTRVFKPTLVFWTDPHPRMWAF